MQILKICIVEFYWRKTDHTVVMKPAGCAGWLKKKKKKKSPKGIYQTATAHLMCTSLVCYNHTRCHLKKPPSASYLQPDLVYSLYKPRKLHLNYACAATGPRATRVKKNQQNSCYLVLNGSHVALIPPVQRTRGLQEVGLQEQGPLHLSLCFMLVAVHELPELLVGLWEQRQECK